MGNVVINEQGQIWDTTIAPINGYTKLIHMLPVYIKRLTRNAKIPTRGSSSAAGYDLYADISDASALAIQPHQTALINTGLSFALPEGTFLGIYPRSGLAYKQGLRPANCVGVIDSDYRGEVMVALHNDTNEIRYVENRERIAQGILHSYLPMDFIDVKELPITERGEGGFGSTGSK